jgi:hypothetical protein
MVNVFVIFETPSKIIHSIGMRKLVSSAIIPSSPVGVWIDSGASFETQTKTVRPICVVSISQLLEKLDYNGEINRNSQAYLKIPVNASGSLGKKIGGSLIISYCSVKIDRSKDSGAILCH